MNKNKILKYVKDLLDNIPPGWIDKTTHRLDIYNESLAKIEFLEQLESLFQQNNSTLASLTDLPTAFDYIRLGHPLSCVLEWTIAKLNMVNSENVISFSSQTMPILAILRKNLLEKKNTNIYYLKSLPINLNTEKLKSVYGYNFKLIEIESIDEIQMSEASNIMLTKDTQLSEFIITKNIDFIINILPDSGSIVLVSEKNSQYISEIQHVRRRETIAMTPANSLNTIKALVNNPVNDLEANEPSNKSAVLCLIQDITQTKTKALLGSCGLSIQYSILMGLIDNAQQTHKNKCIKIIVPPNCYGGTNDQARRVAACLENVEVVDLPVDSGSDMTNSIDSILSEMAKIDAVPFIIAEIPTNPRVEVPHLLKLKQALSKQRKTPNDQTAVEPVFILDQTFCPNIHFLGDDEVLSSIKTIAYVSGSKFPSGGLCTAGYCVANTRASYLIESIDTHLKICDNEATPQQVKILSEKLPSMNQRINDAYHNTRDFVNCISSHLPEAKINFVSNELAEQGFTPSVFSLDLPTKGTTPEERETYKRELNYKLINLMIKEIPNESKHCVSYGQLKGCYWTIPATSTQGTTKESDKDYIVRVSIAPEMDIELHKKVFKKFVESI